MMIKSLKERLRDPITSVGEGVWWIGSGFHSVGDLLDRVGDFLVYRGMKKAGK